ncbi:leucyl/phenylalanyl-tRNA--protein transferase [Pseudoalteromonas sp. BDTF-M6]|uniref:leucyl/phenylalanyl-tRNA--protein transferase n=1 Tax=Pseudoalteromonas sp. BDTF-M6 TaxID=2796132 RepID=UPI001BAE91A2|nr:leucyl/phenylalanyl-tRNA--protein transferase [Pseudoalteromonas sp. BDTF-M6]MBS3796633.1 leucyl/phenylalanyl-tRNA--protein transferase [Pseudoalteromonas sp. BDTF-M6]
MTQYLHYLGSVADGFPDPNTALTQPDGLLAIGGCLSLARLQQAYQQGIFPWYSEGEPLMWWSPSERAIIELDEFHVSRSLKKAARRLNTRVTINTCFTDVIHACKMQRQDTEGTWITDAMEQAYIHAHENGLAHSVEVWQGDSLVGGLYGIMQSRVFCGESMFFRVPECSKLAMWALVELLKANNGAFIDCQLMNPYLAQLGAKALSRQQFLTKLKESNHQSIDLSFWQARQLETPYDATPSD